MGFSVPPRMMGNVGSSLAMAAGALGLKTVGSYFRVLDTEGAPREIQHQTQLREAITLGITALTSFATQLTAPLLEKAFHLPQGKSGLLRTGLVFVGYVLAESIGRLFTSATYADMAKHFQPSASSAENVLKQITHYLWGQPTHTYPSFSSSESYTALNPANFGRTPNTAFISSPTFYSRHPYHNHAPSAFSTVSYLA